MPVVNPAILSSGVKSAEEFIDRFDQNSEKPGLQLNTEEMSWEDDLPGSIFAEGALIALGDLPSMEQTKVLEMITDSDDLTREDHLGNIGYFSDLKVEKFRTYLEKAKRDGVSVKTISPEKEMARLKKAVGVELKQKIVSRGGVSEALHYMKASKSDLLRGLASADKKTQARAVSILEAYRPDVFMKLSMHINFEDAFALLDRLSLMFNSHQRPSDREIGLAKFAALKALHQAKDKGEVMGASFGGMIDVNIFAQSPANDFIDLSFDCKKIPPELSKLL